MAIQPDGRILAAGGADLAGTQFDFALVRYNADGSLDSTFGIGGKATTDFNGRLDAASAIALQTDSKIILAGFATAGDPHMALARYNPNGTLDSSFGTAGKVRGSHARMRALHSIRRPHSMSLLAAWAISWRFSIIELMPNRLHRLQVSKDGFQIIVGHLSIEIPGH